MRNFILDLDGTLMPSHEVDNVCYWRAVAQVFDTPAGTRDLGRFKEVTDSSILAEWTRVELDRDPESSELHQLRAVFLELLREAAGSTPEAFRPLPGVKAWLACCVDRDDTAVGIATGGWSHSARFKLEQSGLSAFRLPLASADDAPSRIAIMRTAVARLGHRAADAPCTYVGDQPWDADCSRELGWDFIGIASGERATALRSAGAERICSDFRELARECRARTMCP